MAGGKKKVSECGGICDCSGIRFSLDTLLVAKI